MEKLYQYLPEELVTFILVTVFSLLIGLSLRRISLKREGETTLFGTDRTFTFIGILGTLGLGIAEFTMMGILPYVAADLNIGIPVAGHFISAYALGVCAGAPMLILARKRPLKHILLALMALMLVGNLGAAMATGYWSLLAARFISGLPHGAYFGVASIVAGKLADEGRSSEAVSIMIAGMTVANPVSYTHLTLPTICSV